jgi:uncharacterized membrane-anchored protein YitT (DUF2179 family)
MKNKLIKLEPKRCILALLGSAILAFGLYNVHSFSGVTEGGILGLTLLIDHWFDISPALSGLVLNGACYVFGFFTLGMDFVMYSAIAGGGFSLFYAIFERFEPLWPQLAEMPLAAAVVGALFVGVGVGICVRAGSAPGGDDALAMGLEKLTKIKIQWLYLISDIIVLALSVTYIPLRRLIYSLLTVIISGQLVGIIQRAGLNGGKLINGSED